MINISYGNSGLPDLYFLFKKDTEYKAYLRHEESPKAKFRATDVVSQHSGEANNNGISAQSMEYLTIKTNAKIKFNVNDILVSVKDKGLWLVNKITVDDSNEEKEFNSNPAKWTILELSRAEL